MFVVIHIPHVGHDFRVLIGFFLALSNALKRMEKGVVLLLRQSEGRGCQKKFRPPDGNHSKFRLDPPLIANIIHTAC